MMSLVYVYQIHEKGAHEIKSAMNKENDAAYTLAQSFRDQ